MTGVLAVASSAVTSTASRGVNVTAVLISVGIPLVVFATVAVIVAGYFRLQAHRADAVAMASYRKLAEDAVANQQELRAELAKLTAKVEVVEQLMRAVG